MKTSNIIMTVSLILFLGINTISQTGACAPTYYARNPAFTLQPSTACTAYYYGGSTPNIADADKYDHWAINWKNNGDTLYAEVNFKGHGECGWQYDATYLTDPNAFKLCYPEMYSPATSDNRFSQDIRDAMLVGQWTHSNPRLCSGGLYYTKYRYASEDGASCSTCPSGQVKPHLECGEFSGICTSVNTCGVDSCPYRDAYCSSYRCGWCVTENDCFYAPAPCPYAQMSCDLSVGKCQFQTPILIDVIGNGFAMTDAPAGVVFDVTGAEHKARVSWTSANSDDAWLALDRDNNGTIDSTVELFGNKTPQPNAPSGEVRNGFLALAEYDKPVAGGNGDRQIDSKDAVYSKLLLWQDTNHNGISESAELHSLPDLNIAAFELDYHESKKTDEHGNQFKYRAKIWDAQHSQIGRWAWDVIFTRAQ